MVKIAVPMSARGGLYRLASCVGLPSFFKSSSCSSSVSARPQRRFALLNLREDVVAQFPGDVFLLRLGQRELYRLQIAFNPIHNLLLKNSVERSVDALPLGR